MKALLCTFDEVETEVIALEDLFPTADIYERDFYLELMAEVRELGDLEFPIVVARCLGSEWNKLVENQTVLHKAPTEDDVYDFVTCGNNRVVVAKELGYTHISCLVVPKFHLGSQYCKRMRKWYDKKRGRRNRE